MTEPLVSVLVPARNAAPTIEVALESVLAQTWPAVEVIVVDDRSVDGTRALVDRYRRAGVRLLEGPGRGAAAARSVAFAAARGELVKFFDADDVLSPDCLALQVSRIAGRSDVVASAEWGRFVDSPGETTFAPERVWRDLDPVTWLAEAWRGARPMMQPGIFLVPRAVLDRAGGWDEGLSLVDDFEFFTRVLLAAREVRFAAGARLHYRSQVTGSLSQRKDRAAIESACRAYLLGTGQLMAAEDSPRTRAACADILQEFIFATYPAHPDLLAKASARLREIGRSDLAPDGPAGFQALRAIVGWRIARRVERLLTARGLSRSGLRRRLAGGA